MIKNVKSPVTTEIKVLQGHKTEQAGTHLGYRKDKRQGPTPSQEAHVAVQRLESINYTGDVKMERIYTIPLREVKKTPRPKRAAKATRFIRKFIEKHMKSDAVKIDNKLNELVWKDGIKNIPSKVKVKAESREDGTVLVTPAE